MALPNKKRPYDPNISSRRLNKELNFQFDRGWSPVLSPVKDGYRTVLQIIDWVGGEGDKPFDATSNTYYLGDSSIVTDIHDAVDISNPFNVPIYNLTTELIEEIESRDNITPDTPFYMLVAEDMRTGGRHTDTCSEICINQCCDLNSDGGYEERGNREGITGCLCEDCQDEIQAVCRVTVTALGNVGDRYEVLLNNIVYTWYDVKTGDTIEDVVNGLINNIPTVCGENDCSVINITSNSFDLIARVGLGSTPNGWTKSVLTTGSAGLTFEQITNGQDYLPETYRGVRHHLISYDGSRWIDFGNSLSFGNYDGSSTGNCSCTFLSMKDTPDTFENFAGYIPIVNNTENSLEWIEFSFENLVDKPNLYYDCTVGNNGDYATLKDAIDDGNKKLLVISDITETVGEWNIDTDFEYIIDGYDKYTITFDYNSNSDGITDGKIKFTNLNLHFNSKAINSYFGSSYLFLENVIIRDVSSVDEIDFGTKVNGKKIEIYLSDKPFIVGLKNIDDIYLEGNVPLTIPDCKIRLDSCNINNFRIEGSFGILLTSVSSYGYINNAYSINGHTGYIGGQDLTIRNSRNIRLHNHNGGFKVYDSDLYEDGYGLNNYYYNSRIGFISYHTIRVRNSKFFNCEIRDTSTENRLELRVEGNEFFNCEFLSRMFVSDLYADNKFYNCKFSSGEEKMLINHDNIIFDNCLFSGYTDITIDGSNITFKNNKVNDCSITIGDIDNIENNNVVNNIVYNGSIEITLVADKTLYDGNRTLSTIVDNGSNSIVGTTNSLL